MRIVHDPAGEARELATDAEVAESAVEQARGLMFRSAVPEGYGLVFPFDSPAWPLSLLFDDAGWRSIHMLFVRVPLDVLWLVDDEVRKVETLAPWRGVALGKADTVVELPAGAAESVSEGDVVVVEERGGADVRDGE